MFPIPHFDSLDRAHLSSAFPRIEEIARQFAAQVHAPGLAYGVVVEGQLITSGAAGLQNIAHRTPASPTSVFRIASMSKSFTAMAIVKLRDDGQLQLDQPAQHYVPELSALRYPTRDSAPITVRHLLTMGAGFPQDDPWADRQLGLPEPDFTALLGEGISFSNPPGWKYEYSNYGYAILGRIITNVSGLPYQTYITRNILQPLGMTDTTYDIARVDPARLAMGYRREGDGWAEEPPLPDGTFGSMGGLFTTVTDFARYMTFLLSAFPARDDADDGPVRRSSLREMQQPWRQRGLASFRTAPDQPAFTFADGYGYGLGCGTDSQLGYSVAHGGGLPGYGTFYRLLPDRAAGVVVLTNITYAGAARCVDDIFLALKNTGSLPTRALPVTPALREVQTALTNLYQHWDDSAARAIATETFFQDMPLEQRRQQFAALRASIGPYSATTPAQPENALRARWRIIGQRGHIELFATLAPTVPPRLQYLELTAARRPNPALRALISRLIALINRWDSPRARTLFARPLKLRQLQAHFEALRVQYGQLRFEEVLEGDGVAQARLRLVGSNGAVDLALTLDPRSGKVTSLTFTRPRDTAFVP